MSTHQQVYSMFVKIVEAIEAERLDPLGKPLMIGGGIPANVPIPDELKKYITGTACHQALKQAIIDVTLSRM